MLYDTTLRCQKELIQSSDGSFTLYSKEFEEAYHSTNDGALHESLQKHIIPAFELKKDMHSLNILDICFGLGYNTFGTIYYLKKHHSKTKVHIVSPEFDEELVASLGEFKYPSEFDDIAEIIKEVSQNKHYKNDQFEIEVIIGDARDILRGQISNFKIDIIYQDAFSPKTNPLLWTREWFGDIKQIADKNAILTTYATAASVRMALDENGFDIYRYTPPNARPSLIATLADIEPLKKMEWIDMELKKQRNPNAKSLRDIDLD